MEHEGDQKTNLGDISGKERARVLASMNPNHVLAIKVQFRSLVVDD